MYNLSRNNRDTSLKIRKGPKASQAARNIFIFLLFLIPVFSVESIFAWYIFFSASHKTIKLHRNDMENKIKKSLIILLVSVILALAFNIIVHYSSKIIVIKTV